MWSLHTPGDLLRVCNTSIQTQDAAFDGRYSDSRWGPRSPSRRADLPHG